MPTCPQPLGIWEIPGGRVKSPLLAATPGSSIPWKEGCSAWSGLEVNPAAGPTVPVPQVTLGCTPHFVAAHSPPWMDFPGRRGRRPQVPIHPPITSLVTLGQL